MAIVSLHRSPWTWQFVLFKLNDVGAKKTSKKRTAPDAILQKITCTKLRVKISENATIGRFLGLVYRLPSSIYSSPQGMTSTTEYILGGLLLHRQNFLEYGDILFMLQKFHDHHLRCILTKKHDMTKKSKPSNLYFPVIFLTLPILTGRKFHRISGPQPMEFLFTPWGSHSSESRHRSLLFVADDGRGIRIHP